MYQFPYPDFENSESSTKGEQPFSLADLPFAYPCSIGLPVIILTTTMLLHVYRNIRLGYYRDYMDSVPTSSLTQMIDETSSSHRPQPILFNKNSGIVPELSRSTSRSSSGSTQGNEKTHIDSCNSADTGPGSLRRKWMFNSEELAA
jgi:hypothetical protein